jgi:hypothetical protein
LETNDEYVAVVGFEMSARIGLQPKLKIYSLPGVNLVHSFLVAKDVKSVQFYDIQQRRLVAITSSQQIRLQILKPKIQTLIFELKDLQ